MAAKRGPRKVTEAHKKAMAEGRVQSAAVRRYLEAVRANKPKRGRKRTPDSINKRLAAIDRELANADALKDLKLRQERVDLKRELSAMSQKVDLSALEAGFIGAASHYAERNRIAYQVWRESGVSAAVLKKAGITR